MNMSFFNSRFLYEHNHIIVLCTHQWCDATWADARGLVDSQKVELKGFSIPLSVVGKYSIRTLIEELSLISRLIFLPIY